MHEGPENSNKNNVIQFKSQADLEKEARTKMMLAHALKAIATAAEGRGALIQNITESDRETLSHLRDEVNEISEYALANPFDEQTPEMVRAVMQRLKVGLAPYLSEAQYVELFGSGSLA